MDIFARLLQLVVWLLGLVKTFVIEVKLSLRVCRTTNSTDTEVNDHPLDEVIKKNYLK